MMHKSSFLGDFDPDVLIKQKDRLINKYFSGAIDAAVAWEVPVGEVTVGVENPAPHITESSPEYQVLVSAANLFKAGKYAQAISEIEPLCEARFVEALELRVLAEIRSGGDHTHWSTLLNNANKPIKKTPAAGLYKETGRIVIHPYLHHVAAPRYVVAYLIYHELCHLVDDSHGDDPHSDSFMELERAFPHRQAAKDWLQQNGFPVVWCE